MIIGERGELGGSAYEAGCIICDGMYKTGLPVKSCNGKKYLGISMVIKT
jgi:hypothetical protein